MPGVRENGGQYTHAALWTLTAYAMLGDGDRAGELFALLNPINHASTRAGLHKYRVEPYVAGAILAVVAAIGAIPGIGLVIVGPIATALAGAGAGGLTGGIIGALIGWGIPEERRE